MDSERDAYDAWASTTLGDAEEPWTGDMAEEGLAEPACPYAFMAAQRKPEQIDAEQRRPIISAMRWMKASMGWRDTQAPGAALHRAIGRHVAGGLQIGLRTL